MLGSISFIINFKKLKNIFIENGMKKLKAYPILLLALALILIFIQLFVLFKCAHIDDDDAFYVATATTTIDTHSLFKYAAQTGREYGNDFPDRYTLGPFPIYLAILSYFVNIRPAILCHTILPVIFIFLVYIIYALIANEIFDNDKKSILLFLILMSFINIWGNYSIRSTFSFLLFRIWQGKSMLANFILPVCWLIFLKVYNSKFLIKSCILFFILSFAGCLTTTMGIIMLPITLGVLSVLFCIKDKIISYVIKIIITCFPCFLYGIIYFIIRS